MSKQLLATSLDQAGWGFGQPDGVSGIPPDDP